MIDEKLLSFSEIPEGSLAAVAARKHGCTLDDLLKWREDEDGTVVIILATGQKYTYSAIEMLGHVAAEMFGPGGSGLPDGGCAGTGAVVHTGDRKLVTGIRDPGTDEQRSSAAVAKGKPIAGDSLVTAGAEPGAGENPSGSLISEAEPRGDVTKNGEVVTPIAGDSQTPDPGAGVENALPDGNVRRSLISDAERRGNDTKSEEVVTPVADQPTAGDAAAAPVSKTPAARRSPRRRTKKADPDK